MKKLFALLAIASLAAIGCDDKKSTPKGGPTTTSPVKTTDNLGTKPPPADTTKLPPVDTTKPSSTTSKKDGGPGLPGDKDKDKGKDKDKDK